MCTSRSTWSNNSNSSNNSNKSSNSNNRIRGKEQHHSNSKWLKDHRKTLHKRTDLEINNLSVIRSNNDMNRKRRRSKRMEILTNSKDIMTEKQSNRRIYQEANWNRIRNIDNFKNMILKKREKQAIWSIRIGIIVIQGFINNPDKMKMVIIMSKSPNQGYKKHLLKKNSIDWEANWWKKIKILGICSTKMSNSLKEQTKLKKNVSS